jgi:hypothetical protein
MTRKAKIIAKIQELEQLRAQLFIRLSAIDDQIADFRGDLDLLKDDSPEEEQEE